MSHIEQQLKRIQNKLQELLKQHTALLKENQQLKKEIAEANKQYKLQLQHIEELKQQVSILKLASDEMSATDKKDFEKRISFYIKEIDKCIALLSN